MNRYVALFRGINVGGKHILPMQALREILAACDCEDVQTYIQSGNAIFSSAVAASGLSANITHAIEERFGFAPQVLLLTVDRFMAIAAANPFTDADANPKCLHVWFLAENPRAPNLDALNDLKVESERFLLKDDAFYLYAPDGIGRSKLAAKVDRHLGVATTARNWRTVCKIIELANAS
jgi:uncharacterized protein (DUF1697 family)